jgi:2-polyprenyl-3-methyl-5-hydroxy-6-metoxy-1,4-benzoquinol methylase
MYEMTTKSIGAHARRNIFILAVTTALVGFLCGTQYVRLNGATQAYLHVESGDANLTRVASTTNNAKSECELQFWKKRKFDEKQLGNSWYQETMTNAWNISISTYSEKKVLDVGCGPRGSLEFLKDHNAQLVCVDPLAKEYGKLGADRHVMTYIAANAETMPCMDGAFDIVTSVNSLDHVDELHAASQEMIRVLRPGGLMIIQAHINHAPTVCEPSPFTKDDIFGAFASLTRTHFSVHPPGGIDAVSTGGLTNDDFDRPGTGLFMFRKL